MVESLLSRLSLDGDAVLELRPSSVTGDAGDASPGGTPGDATPGYAGGRTPVRGGSLAGSAGVATPNTARGGGGLRALLPHVAWPCTARHVFASCVDVAGIPKKGLLRLLGEHCSDADEKR